MDKTVTKIMTVYSVRCFGVFLAGEYIPSSASVPVAGLVPYSAASSVMNHIVPTTFAVSDFLSLGSFIPPPVYHNNHLSFVVPIHRHIPTNRTNPFLLFSSLTLSSHIFGLPRCLGLYLTPPPPGARSSLVHICCDPFCSPSVHPNCTQVLGLVSPPVLFPLALVLLLVFFYSLL